MNITVVLKKTQNPVEEGGGEEAERLRRRGLVVISSFDFVTNIWPDQFWTTSKRSFNIH